MAKELITATEVRSVDTLLLGHVGTVPTGLCSIPPTTYDPPCNPFRRQNDPFTSPGPSTIVPQQRHRVRVLPVFENSRGGVTC